MTMRVSVDVGANDFRVHEPCEVVLLARCSGDLTAGAAVEVQFPQSWSLVSGPSFTRPLQYSDPAAAHYVQVSAGHGTVWSHEIVPRTQHHPEGHHRHGRLIRAVLAEGVVRAGAPIAIRYSNTFAPFVAETETVWVRIASQPPDTPVVLRTVPAEARSIRVLAPSSVRAGEPFGVLIVSLDRFENASCTCYRDETLCFADGRIAVRGLTFTGRTRVSVTIPEDGTFRLRFGDTLSNAIRVSGCVGGPYWGDIHIHTKLSHDAQGTDPYAYARDVSGLDFAGVADHTESLGDAGYEQVLSWARESHAPGRFVTVLADERNPRQLTGHHNLYFRDEETFLAHRWVRPEPAKVPEDSGPVDPSRIIAAPHHTGIHFGGLRGPGQRTNAVDWDAYEDEAGIRPIMEIYSHHGQSELYSPHHILAYEFNRMRNPERRGNTSAPGPHYAQDFWMRGVRLGVIGSSDEHSGQGGRRHGGVAAVFAKTLTRESVFDALRDRCCYATTGERILVEFEVDGIAMGQCGVRKVGSKVTLRLSVWGTDLLVRVEILKYRFGVDHAFAPLVAELPNRDAHGLDAAVEVEDLIEGPCMYYARVVQEPLSWPGMAWSSPIWIEVE